MPPNPSPRSFAIRICMLAGLFCGEAVLATLLFDGDSPNSKGAWLSAAIHANGSWVARFAIAFSVLFATFAFLRYKNELQSIGAGLEPIRWSLLALHLGAVGLFAFASVGVYSDRLSASDSNLAGLAWVCAAVLAIVATALAFVPKIVWSALARATGLLWLYAAAAAAVTCSAEGMLRSLWRPASQLTFNLVRLFLSPFVSDIVSQPERLRLGTSHFTVIIADECSGLEGIGLLLMCTCLWLVLFRKEARFPQALVLLPLSIVTLFLLNAFRITALVLIGNAGAPDIATGGFHSQAGWISFNAVAFGSAILARRWRWVANPGPEATHATLAAERSHPTVAFLAPFLAILAASMISRAASGDFEWLYSLRFVAALAALWIFRRSYSQLNWRCGALAAGAGVAVFVAWIAADHLAHGSMPMPAALAGASTSVRAAWIGLRILGAVVTVPIAEELAFRGFLLRWFSSIDFESVTFQSVGWLGVLGSSFVFGLMHGKQWWIATLAGLAYALVVRKTGRIGDAVAAHAITNALLAVLVLFFGQWQLW